jgi:hypothetical protein
MPLVDIWRSNPEQLSTHAIRQLVAIAGDGILRDGSACSNELRAFLQEVDTKEFNRFADECLNNAFDGSGFVLQDLVNEIGRRLEFDVEPGLYRGKSNAVGFDGIWKGPGAHIIAEVKTTDLYNVKLDRVADYRRALLEASRIDEQSSLLFVVGRQDTGALEAQIRGSPHAWTMRVIGVDGLLKLLAVKERSTSNLIVRQIQALLRPVEYTRVDGIVDLVFDTASDVEASAESDGDDIADDQNDAASRDVIAEKRTTAVVALSKKLKQPLLKKRRTSFASLDGSARVVVAISKRYDSKSEPYWYAYHTSQDEFLDGGRDSYFVLGCTDAGTFYAIPLDFMRRHLSKMNKTVRDQREYWHVKGRPVSGVYHLVLRGGELISLEQFAIH